MIEYHGELGRGGWPRDLPVRTNVGVYDFQLTFIPDLIRLGVPVETDEFLPRRGVRWPLIVRSVDSIGKMRERLPVKLVMAKESLEGAIDGILNIIGHDLVSAGLPIHCWHVLTFKEFAFIAANDISSL